MNQAQEELTPAPADFKEARRRRRRKKTIRRTSRFLILAIILAVVVLIGFVGYQLDWGSHFSSLIASLRPGSGYPVALDQNEVTQLIGMNGSVAVSASGSVSIYNTGGEMTGYFANSYSDPISVYSGGKLLTYDLGGSGWMVTNKTKALHSQNAKGMLLGATIGEKGYVAVSCRDSAYLSEVTVYNARYEQMYIWDSADCYVNQLAISHNGTLLATGGILSSGGSLDSVVKIHDMTGSREETGMTLPDSVILSIVWTDKNQLQVVTDRGVYLFGKEGTLVSSVTFTDAPVALANSADGVIYIAAGDYRSSQGVTITAYDSALQPVGTTSLKMRILSLQYEKKHLYILAENELLLSDPSLTEVIDRGRSGLQMIAPYGNAYYGITNEGLLRERL